MLARAARPFGVSALTTLYAVVAALLLLLLVYQRFQGKTYFGSHQLITPWDRGYGSYLVAMYLVTITASTGAFVGDPRCRILLLAVLTFWMAVIFMMFGNKYAFLLPDTRWLGSISSWWGIDGPMSWSSWVAMNYWYFFSARARSFYRPIAEIQTPGSP